MFKWYCDVGSTGKQKGQLYYMSMSTNLCRVMLVVEKRDWRFLRAYLLTRHTGLCLRVRLRTAYVMEP